MHQLIQKEYRSVSPIHGYTLLSSGILKNLRFFGNYGAKKEPYGCLELVPERIHEECIEFKDCPLDYVSELIQRLFPSIDDEALSINQYPGDIIKKISFENLGKILNRISSVKDTELLDLHLKESLVLDLTAILMGEREFFLNARAESLKREKVFLEKKKKDALRKKKSDSEEIDLYDNRLEKIKIALEKIFLELKKYKTIKKSPLKMHDCESFSKVIVGALIESRISPLKYPRNLPEHLFSSFMILKGQGKEDFLSFLSHAELITTEDTKKIIHGHSKEDQEKRASFLSERYTQKDSKDMIERISEIIQSEDLLHKREKGSFFIPVEYDFKSESEYFNQEKLAASLRIYDREFSQIPDLVGSDRVEFEDLSKEIVQPFSDCGETFLRNFFNIMLYDVDSGSFAVDRLNKIPDADLNFKLIEFYKNYSDLEKMFSVKARKDWVQQVVSGLPGVVYRRPPCEIKGTGISNMMIAIECLLFRGGSKHSRSHSILFDPFKNPRTHSQKLDFLCNIFSRPDFILGWYLDETQRDVHAPKLDDCEQNISIVFTINGTPRWSAHFQENHFFIEKIPSHLYLKVSMLGSFARKVGFLDKKNHSQDRFYSLETLSSFYGRLDQVSPWFRIFYQEAPLSDFQDFTENLSQQENEADWIPFHYFHALSAQERSQFFNRDL